MLHKQGHRPSDIESISTEISDSTSRETTLTDSRSDIELESQQILNHSNQVHSPPTEDDGSFTSSVATASVNTVIFKKIDILQTNNNQLVEVTTEHQLEHKTWGNPYWDSKPKPDTAVTESKTDTVNNNTNSSSSANVQQLIPGSILINDQGEIDNLLSKHSTRSKSSESDTSFNPGGKYMSDGSGGPGGYLAPTHTQRQLVTPTLGVVASPEKNSDHKQSIASTNTSKNPNSKDEKSQTSTAANQNTNSAALNKSMSYEYKTFHIPPFYERIYPHHTPLPSSVSIIDTTKKTIFSSELSTQDVNDNEDLPFSSNSQGVVHYRAASSPSKVTNKTAIFAPSSTTSHYSDLPAHTSSSAPLSQTKRSVVSSFSNNNGSPPIMNLSNYPSSTISSTTVLTEEEFDSVQHALHLLKTNPNAIRVLETVSEVPPSNTSHQTNPLSPLAWLLSGNQQQQQQPLPQSNITHPNNPVSPLAALFSGNPQQQSQQRPLPQSNINYQNNPPSPLAALFSGNRQQQSQQQPLPPSNISYQNNPPSPLMSLFSGNRQQQSQQQPLPPSNINYQNNPPSPLAALFSGNPQQQSQQRPLPPSNISYQNNPPSPLMSLFSGNQQQQFQQRPLPPSNISYQNNPPSPFMSSFPGNQQQQPLPPSNIIFQNNPSSPLVSAFPGNQQQQPLSSSNIRRHYSLPSRIKSLFSGQRHQQSQQQKPPLNSSYQNSPPSGLKSLFSGNRQQQPPQTYAGYQNRYAPPVVPLYSGNPQQQLYQQPLPPSSLLQYGQSNSPPYPYYFNPYQPSLFSVPTYPSYANQSLYQLAAPGAFVLI